MDEQESARTGHVNALKSFNQPVQCSAHNNAPGSVEEDSTENVSRAFSEMMKSNELITEGLVTVLNERLTAVNPPSRRTHRYALRSRGPILSEERQQRAFPQSTSRS